MPSEADQAYNVENFLVDDLKTIAIKIAANEGWYKQTWLGVTIWQLPEDIMLLQSIVSSIRPALIIETGTKYGGSSLFFASLVSLLGLDDTKILTIDTVETDEARKLDHHYLTKNRVVRINGSSLDASTLSKVESAVKASSGPVMIFLDDWHDGDHVLEELNAYHHFVGKDGVLIVADTSFADLAGTPVAPYRSLLTSNPRTAVNTFLSESVAFRRSLRFKPVGLSNFSDGVLEPIA